MRALVLIFVLAAASACGTGDCVGADGLIQNANTHAWDGGDLSVVSFNMLFAEPSFLGDSVPAADETLAARLTLLADAIIAARPDLVLLQEVSMYGATGHCDMLRTSWGG